MDNTNFRSFKSYSFIVLFTEDEHPSYEADILGESIKFYPMNVTSNSTTTDTDNGEREKIYKYCV